MIVSVHQDLAVKWQGKWSCWYIVSKLFDCSKRYFKSRLRVTCQAQIFELSFKQFVQEMTYFLINKCEKKANIEKQKISKAHVINKSKRA